MVFAQQSTSFSVLKYCYQNIQEALQGSSTRLEIRLTPRLGKSIHNLKRIKELQFLLGKYPYHEYTEQWVYFDPDKKGNRDASTK